MLEAEAAQLDLGCDTPGNLVITIIIISSSSSSSNSIMSVNIVIIICLGAEAAGGHKISAYNIFASKIQYGHFSY